MPTYVFFLGNNPALSTTELWRYLAAQGYKPALKHSEDSYMAIELARPLHMSEMEGLGGIERVAEIIAQAPDILTQDKILELLTPLPKKMMFGCSAININAPTTRWLVDLKKAARALGTTLKFIQIGDKGSRLNSAQVLFHGLYREPNVELTIIHLKNDYIYARTCWVQDIQVYEQRDTGKPARNAKIGMLPPKLAQIMLTIAASEITPNESKRFSFLDPFCGSGVVLQEGYLKGFAMTGFDNNQAMVEASRKNVAYVQEKIKTNTTAPLPTAALHDVNNSFDHALVNSFDGIVTEPFLGKPIASPLPEEEIKIIMAEVQILYKAFFTNVYPLLKKSGVIVFALPVWRRPNGSPEGGFWRIPDSFIDEICKIGYLKSQLIPQSLEEAYPSNSRGTLIYSRSDAYVGREITLWRKQ